MAKLHTRSTKTPHRAWYKYLFPKPIVIWKLRSLGPTMLESERLQPCGCRIGNGTAEYCDRHWPVVALHPADRTPPVEFVDEVDDWPKDER